jgi:preprotein translocase subunit SecD
MSSASSHSKKFYASWATEPEASRRRLSVGPSGGTSMIAVAIACIIVGALLALRYKVFVLFPAIIVMCAVLGSTGFIWEFSMSQISLEMAGLSIALQLGYLAPLHRSY